MHQLENVDQARVKTGVLGSIVLHHCPAYTVVYIVEAIKWCQQ